jgi:hypothetical protein
MTRDVSSNGQRDARDARVDAKAATGPLTLDTALKRTLGALGAVVGLLAGISVFTAPFVKTGPALIATTLAAFAVIILVCVGFAFFLAYHKRNFIISVNQIGVAIIALAVGAGIGYYVWHLRSAQISPTTSAETAGGFVQTWTDYSDAGGANGSTIPVHETIQVSCKIRGFRVGDGDIWWYRIASAPWRNRFYSSADAFYNDGRTSGSLHGTPFVDARVRNC